MIKFYSIIVLALAISESYGINYPLYSATDCTGDCEVKDVLVKRAYECINPKPTPDKCLVRIQLGTERQDCIENIRSKLKAIGSDIWFRNKITTGPTAYKEVTYDMPRNSKFQINQWTIQCGNSISYLPNHHFADLKDERHPKLFLKSITG